VFFDAPYYLFKILNLCITESQFEILHAIIISSVSSFHCNSTLLQLYIAMRHS